MSNSHLWWVTGTCIVIPVNMGDQLGGVVWCSSGIIFGSCCDGGLWLDQLEFVPSAHALAP